MPNDQHRGNWSMNRIYYQVVCVEHNGLIHPSSASMIVNGSIMSQLVKSAGKKAKFVYDWTGGSVTSL